MYLEEFGFENNKLNDILVTLKNVYDIEITFGDSSADSTIPHMNEMFESWNGVKTKILLESPYNAYNNNPQYMKASLICEAIKLFLSEIAPARKGAKVRTKKMQKMGEAQMSAKKKKEAGGPTDREFEKAHGYPEKKIYKDEELDESQLMEAAIMLSEDLDTQLAIVSCVMNSTNDK